MGSEKRFQMYFLMTFSAENLSVCPNKNNNKYVQPVAGNVPAENSFLCDIPPQTNQAGGGGGGVVGRLTVDRLENFPL